METLFWTVVLLGLAGALFWSASRFEPHWCSPDGTQFTCRVREIDATGRPVSRWYEARAEVVEGKVAIRKKVLMRKGEAADPRAVSARSEHAPRGRSIYFLTGTPMVAIRVPATSRAATCLDALATR